MPSFPVHVDRSFEARSWQHLDDRALALHSHFRIRLPHWMRPVALPAVAPSEEVSPVSMATMRTLSEPRAEIEVIGFHVRREIAPAAFLRPLLADYEILSERSIEALEGEHLDVLTRRTLDTTYLSRWRTVKDGGANGGRLFVLEARTAEAAYPALADDLFAAISSFELLRPSGWPYFERMVSVARAQPADFAIYHPESWRLEVAREDDDGAGVFVAHLLSAIEGRSAGRITITCARDATAASLLDVYVRSLRARGASVELGSAVDAPRFGGLERAWTTRGSASLPRDGTAPGRELAVRVDVGRRGSAWYLLGLMGVGPRVDPLAAASNERALELMRALMRTA